MAFKILKTVKIYHDYRVLLEKYWIVIYDCHNFSYMTNSVFSELTYHVGLKYWTSMLSLLFWFLKKSSNIDK